MDVKTIQNRLIKAGFNITADGDIGPKTLAAILSYTVGRDLGALGILLGRGMASEFPKHGIVTPLRICHFLAQAAHETAGFKHFVELGSGDGPDPDPYDDYLQRYDFRKDLGNNALGMGQKYRGRGIFQLTGYFNYVKFGKRIGIPLDKEPQRAAEPEISVALACLYWSDRGINAPADANDLRAVTKKINGGTNGIDDRARYLARLQKLFS